MSEKKYDLIAIGAGPANVFLLLELHFLGVLKGLNVLCIELGSDLKHRICPAEKNGVCRHCKNCSKKGGFSGQGAFSDGKLTLIRPDATAIPVGGKLEEVLGLDLAKAIILCTDQYYLKFGADPHIEGLENQKDKRKIINKAFLAGLQVLDNPVRHLGTEKARELYGRIYQVLVDDGVNFVFNTKVNNLIVEGNTVKGVVASDLLGKCEQEYFSDIVVSGVGRNGSEWLKSMCEQHSIMCRPGVIDIGVRYELPDSVMALANKLFYEFKVVGNLPPYGDKVRTFCMNPSGYVSVDPYDDGIFGVNGHSYKDQKSTNTNLALLVSRQFINITDPIKLGKNITESMNIIGGGNPIVQRLGDIGYRGTWPTALESNSVRPTLTSAVPGDITDVLGGRITTNIVKFIYAMDKVIPGFAGPDNLLYAVETKLYSNEVVLDSELKTSLNGFYAIGDGGGLTRGLIQASASGVQLARYLFK